MSTFFNIYFFYNIIININLLLLLSSLLLLLLFKGAYNLLTVQLKAYLNLPSLIFVVKGGSLISTHIYPLINIHSYIKLRELGFSGGGRAGGGRPGSVKCLAASNARQRQMLGGVKCRERELLLGPVKGPWGGYQGIISGHYDHHNCHNYHNRHNRHDRYNRHNQHNHHNLVITIILIN